MAKNPPGTRKTATEPYGPRWLLWGFLSIAILQAVIIVATPSNALDLALMVVLVAVATGPLIMLILSHRAKRAGAEGQEPEDPTVGE